MPPDNQRVWHLLHAGPPAAQSNTAGRGHLHEGESSEVEDELIFAFGFRRRTIAHAREPLEMNEVGRTGCGPMLPFARAAVGAGFTGGQPILIVPAARGGTRLVANDEPTWRSSVRGSLWDDWCELRADAIAEIERRGERWVDFAAISIHGESDGDALTPGDEYRMDYDANIAAMRAVVGDRMPLMIGGMVPEYVSTGTRAEIRRIQRSAPERHRHVLYVDSPGSLHLDDGNHFSADGAQAVALLLFQAFADARKTSRL